MHEENKLVPEIRVNRAQLDGQLTLKAAKLGVWQLDLANRMMCWDEQCQELVGLASPTLTYEEFLGYVHPDDAVRVKAAIDRAMQPASDGDYSLMHRMGGSAHAMRSVRFTGQVYVDEAGKAQGLAGVVQAMSTDAMNQPAAGSEAHFRHTVAQAPVAMALLSGPELVVTLANERVLHYWGRTPEQVLNKPLFEALPSARSQGLENLLLGVYTTGERFVASESAMSLERNGQQELTYIDFVCEPYRGADGSISGVTVVCSDVTSQVMARQKIEESEAYFRQLTDDVPAIIWTTQADGRCNYINRQWYDFTGQTKEEAEGFGWLDATHPDDKMQAGQTFLDANERHLPFRASYRLRNKEGGYRWVIDLASPRFDANGVYKGMIGTVVDIHEQKEAEREKQKVLALIDASHEFIGLAGMDGTAQYVNPAALELMGWEGIAGRKILDCVYPDDRDMAEALVRKLVDTGHISQEIRFLNEPTGEPFWVQWNGVVIRDETSGKPIALGTVSPNINERRNVARALEESEARLRSLIANAPVGIGLFMGRDLLVELPNQTFIDIVGKGSSIEGKPLREVLPEAENQPLLQLLDEVYTTGRMRQLNGVEVSIMQRGIPTRHFFNMTYTPLLNASGEVYAILGIGVDVTEQVRAQRRLEESELFARSVIDTSPIAKTVLVGEYMIIKTVNERMLEMLGRDASIIGKPFMDAVPELQQTPLMECLQRVQATGETIYQPEVQLELIRFGKPYTGYYNYIYKSLIHTTGERYGVLITATEITDQVLARQKIEESEKQFRALLEAIPAIAWTNSPTGEITFYNQRLYDYTGLTFEEVRDRGWQSIVHPDDLTHSLSLYTQALATGQDYVVENRYRRADGTYRWHLNRALPLRDEAGQITQWVGTSTDIHEQKQQEAELERQVEARTQQLHASIQDLKRSNDNLQQFAYIASHDLQEPLRKIQSFGVLLTTDYADRLGDGADYLVRMQSAASRMSILIRDLLTYSRISTRQEAAARVPLSEIVHHALADLDLIIDETDARVEVGSLPLVQGDKTQLSQLFQNLLSNALKFRRLDDADQWVAPIITIRAELVPEAELPGTIQPTRMAAAYHRIDVTDNGIGFQEEYVDRIFQVFQRLHGKNEFAGTGIGLAICEKVAANHGGAISATSKPGEGATFSVYFPVVD